MSDFQRRRVYLWEDEHIARKDPTTIPFNQAQAMVDAIWRDHDLAYPPRVERLPRQASARLADASRLTLRLPEQLPSWCLLHELAHAMTSTHDGASDQHGPIFMGIYITMLERYLRLPRTALLASLREAGIAVAEHARPVFLD